jgi:hypothetical protein
MYRCVLAAVAALMFVLPEFAFAQVQRYFPQTALRGEIAIGDFPQIALNGQATRLAPGSRIRDANNLLTTPASLNGQRFVAHYTLEATTGLVMDVWVLRSDELARRPWPRTPQEAASWRFDPAEQAWTRP